MADADSEGSVSCWIDALKAGNPAAAQPLWERYFESLVRIAGAKLRSARGLGIVEDEEDAALSAFESFCTGAMQGRYPRLSDRDDLWHLLVLITARKAYDQLERAGSKKRGGGRVVQESVVARSDMGREQRWFDTIPGAEPTPEFAAMVAEEYIRLLELLPDEKFRSIAVWKMEGHTREEIAAKLGCATKTVANKLDYIRKAWNGSAL